MRRFCLTVLTTLVIVCLLGCGASTKQQKSAEEIKIKKIDYGYFKCNVPEKWTVEKDTIMDGTINLGYDMWIVKGDLVKESFENFKIIHDLKNEGNVVYNKIKYTTGSYATSSLKYYFIKGNTIVILTILNKDISPEVKVVLNSLEYKIDGKFANIDNIVSKTSNDILMDIGGDTGNTVENTITNTKTKIKSEIEPYKPSTGRTWVPGYTKKNGTYVKGYWRD